MPTPPTTSTRISAVPLVMRVVCTLLAVTVVVVMVVTALVTHPSDELNPFDAADRVAIAGIGLFVGAGILLLGRPRVDADASGIRVRNLLGQRTLPWAAVRGVRFDRRAWVATLELANGDAMPVTALQAVDGERAATAVEGLRALLAADVAARPAPAHGPLLHE
ncbi:PH domain-containing protein [Geodermatophilus sp. SYSU D01036]